MNMVYPYQHNNGYPYAYGAPPYQEPQINASYEQHIPMASNLTSKLSNFASKIFSNRGGNVSSGYY
jgi:hypothetical protein